MSVEDSPLHCFSLLVFVCLTEIASTQDVEDCDTRLVVLPPSFLLSFPSFYLFHQTLRLQRELPRAQRQTPELQAADSLLLLVKLTYLITKSLTRGTTLPFSTFFAPMLMSCARPSLRNPSNSECCLSEPSNDGSAHRSPPQRQAGGGKLQKRSLILCSFHFLSDSNKFL